VDECPITFNENELLRHEQQFRGHSAYHKVHELASKILRTDAEGWLMSGVDVEKKRMQNVDWLKEVMRRSEECGMEPEEVRRIWPYVEREA
jgi:hypothetical protein